MARNTARKAAAIAPSLPRPSGMVRAGAVARLDALLADLRLALAASYGAGNVKEGVPGDYTIRQGGRVIKATVSSGARGDVDYAPKVAVEFYWADAYGCTSSAGSLQAGSLAVLRAFKALARWAAANAVRVGYRAEPARHRLYGKVLAACGMTLLQVQGGDTPGAYYSATWGA
jgi:hypothetical protein